MERLLFVINARAGRGEVNAKAVDCINVFQQAGYEVTVHVTQGTQDATHIIQQRAGEFDRIVCAGGDGTLGEAVSGLMQLENRPVLGYIPAGTTNDFAFSIDLPRAAVDAARIAVEGRLRALDIGRFNDRYFNYIAAFGAFTEVSYATPQQSKNIFGRAAYLFEGVKSLGNIRTHSILVQSEEFSEADEYIYGMVSNTVSLGGFKGLAPENVELDDGLYEVLLIYPVNNPLELQWLINDLVTHCADSSRYTYFRTSKIIFESEKEVPWTLDGEFGGATTLAEIENNSRAILFATGL